MTREIHFYQQNTRSRFISLLCNFYMKLMSSYIIAVEFFTYAQKCQYGISVFTVWKEKKSSDKMLSPVGIEPRPFIASDSKSNTLLSTLTWNMWKARVYNKNSVRNHHFYFRNTHGSVLHSFHWSVGNKLRCYGYIFELIDFVRSIIKIGL